MELEFLVHLWISQENTQRKVTQLWGKLVEAKAWYVHWMFMSCSTAGLGGVSLSLLNHWVYCFLQNLSRNRLRGIVGQEIWGCLAVSCELSETCSRCRLLTFPHFRNAALAPVSVRLSDPGDTSLCRRQGWFWAIRPGCRAWLQSPAQGLALLTGGLWHRSPEVKEQTACVSELFVGWVGFLCCCKNPVFPVRGVS